MLGLTAVFLVSRMTTISGWKLYSKRGSAFAHQNEVILLSIPSLGGLAARWLSAFKLSLYN